MEQFTVNSIGKVRADNSGMRIELKKEFIAALTNLEGLRFWISSLDRVEHPIVPQWCSLWPKNIETSGDFDWSSVFNF